MICFACKERVLLAYEIDGKVYHATCRSKVSNGL